MIKERREIHAKLVANKDATRDFIIRDTQIEGDEMVPAWPCFSLPRWRLWHAHGLLDD